MIRQGSLLSPDGTTTFFFYPSADKLKNIPRKIGGYFYYSVCTVKLFFFLFGKHTA